MKCWSPGVSVAQSLWSWLRSISSAVQNDATCFLYICQMDAWRMGNSTKRPAFSRSSSSSEWGAGEGERVEEEEEEMGVGGEWGSEVGVEERGVEVWVGVAGIGMVGVGEREGERRDRRALEEAESRGAQREVDSSAMG